MLSRPFHEVCETRAACHDIPPFAPDATDKGEGRVLLPSGDDPDDPRIVFPPAEHGAAGVAKAHVGVGLEFPTAVLVTIIIEDRDAELTGRSLASCDITRISGNGPIGLVFPVV